MKLRRTSSIYKKENDIKKGDVITRVCHSGTGAFVEVMKRVINIFEADYGVTDSIADIEKYVAILTEKGYKCQNKVQKGADGKYHIHIDHYWKKFNFGWR